MAFDNFEPATTRALWNACTYYCELYYPFKSDQVSRASQAFGHFQVEDIDPPSTIHRETACQLREFLLEDESLTISSR
jgi:hypothetical protein